MIQLLEQLKLRKITIEEASIQLGMSQRQIYRLKKRYAGGGAPSLIHRGRGKKSTKKIPQHTWEKVDDLIKKQLAGAGPTFIAEKCKELFDITLSRESIRKHMHSYGFILKTRKRYPYRSKRPRKMNLGSMAQLDGSFHHWFGDAGPQCSLIVIVDDATSMILGLFFAPHESTFAVMQALTQYFKSHGLPQAIYTDKHSIYRINDQAARERGALTNLEKALKKLGVELIHAHSPQAKGRVERMNASLQDRLVLEMRLRGIVTIEDANAYVPQFIEAYNKQFAKQPLLLENKHRPFVGYDLTELFVMEEERKLQRDWTIRYNSATYQVHRHQPVRLKPKDNIIARAYPDGTLKFFYKNHQLEASLIPENTLFEVSNIPQKARAPFFLPDTPPLGFREKPKVTFSLCSKG